MPANHYTTNPNNASHRARNAVRFAALALHGAGAVAVLVLSFACRVTDFNQHGQITVMLPVGNLTDGVCRGQAECFRASVPWMVEEPSPTFVLNAFPLIVAFEWISAAFALFYLRELFRPAHDAALIWLAVGFCLFTAWHGYWGVWSNFQLFVGLMAFLLSAAVIWAFDEWANATALSIANHYARQLPPGAESRLEFSQLGGRVWATPARVSGLLRLGPAESASVLTALSGCLVQLEVIARYAEYCLSAPLLYLAVFCLLVVDAPVWMYVTGFAMILVCNVFGMLLHMAVVLEGCQEAFVARHQPGGGALPSPTLLSRALAILGLGTWRTPWVNKVFFMEGAWVGLAVGLGILGYAARGVLLNPDIPWFALAGVWNLLATFLLFGVIPSAMYLLRFRLDLLDVALDVLSVSAKFPEAVFVVAMYLSRPVGSSAC